MKRIFLTTAFLLLPWPGMAETLYVQSLQAKLMESPAFDAPVLVVVEKGAALTVVETRDAWRKVSTGSHTGWASQFVLGAQPPLDKISVFSGKEQGIAANSRRRASAVTTAGAARGLNADERTRASGAEIADFKAVERMEALKMEERDIERFVEEGVAP